MLNKEFIFILFPNGLCGNHFKNLLGLYSNLYKKEDIVPIYDSVRKHAHQDTYSLRKHEIISEAKTIHYDTNKNTKILLSGHIEDYLIHLAPLFNQVRNRQFIVFNWTINDLKKLIKRLKYVEAPLPTEDTYQIYQICSISKLVNCSEDKISILDVGELISIDILNLLKYFAEKTNLETNYNTDICKILHRKWLIKNNLLSTD